MAESVVSFAVETIGKLLIDEAKLLWGVEGKLEDLQKELNLIRGLLRDADTKQEHNQAVRLCVAQLRDIAYDAEDVIEQYILRVAPKKGQKIIKACACFMAKCTCVQAHVVGMEIDGLISSISKLRTSMRDHGIQLLNEGERNRARDWSPKQTYAHFEEEDFIGREDSIKVLVRELLKDGEQHKVISIWGMGGLGKTTLAQKVFTHDEVKNHFKSSAWACISQKYCVRDILEGILVKLIPNQKEEVMKMRDDKLLETLYNIQKQKRCIVVLDDIWTEQAWDSLQAAFPIKDTRSKLLITTRNREVAEHIDPHCFLHEPQFLSHQESWVLLQKRAFPKTKAVEPSFAGLGVGRDIIASQAVEGIARQSEMEGQIPVITEGMKKLGDELLKKCGGLPLAIIVLGGLLAVNEWKTVLEKINLHFNDKSYLSKVLALSYDDLPWPLKPCFQYLGSFPEDTEIPAKSVLRLWIAEGFVPRDAYDEERRIAMEDVAEQYLMELVKRGLVQVRLNLYGNIKTCRLHDLMRDLCVSKAGQEGLLSFYNIQQNNEREGSSSSMAKEVESTRKTRRLSLNMHLIGEGKGTPRVQIEKTMPHLRTLLFFQSGGFYTGIWEEFQTIFINCKFIRVLKLENLFQMRGKLLDTVGDLVHLRFLSLAGSGFEGLPQSMGNLIHMEFLNLQGNAYIEVSMPNVLSKMRRLRYLCLPYKFDVKEKLNGDRKKLQLGTLKDLRTLRNFSLKKCDVNDVGKLTNLQKLTILDCYNPNELEIFSQLAKFDLKHLRSSSFCFEVSGCSWTEGEMSKMPKYCHSHKLYIKGKIEKLPEHKNLPQQLRKLILRESRLKEDPMPILEKLDHLVVLMLESAFVGKEMVCSVEGFPQLKYLFLCAFDYLEELRVPEGAMPRPSQVRVFACNEFKGENIRRLLTTSTGSSSYMALNIFSV